MRGEGIDAGACLARQLGHARLSFEDRACVVGAFATIVVGMLLFIVSDSVGVTQWALFGLAAWPLAIRPMEAIGSATGRDLVPVLTATAATHAACGLLMALGLVLSNTV